MNENLNCFITVSYKDHNYHLEIQDYDGKVLAEGNNWDSSVLKLLKQTSVGPEWFVNKANETYVWDINHGTLKLGDWWWGCTIEGGTVEDWGDCHNFE